MRRRSGPWLVGLCLIAAVLVGCSERRHIRKGDLLMATEDYEEAIEHYQTSIENDMAVEEAHKKLREAYLKWAESYYNLKNYPKALEKVEFILDQYPHSREALTAQNRKLRYLFLIARDQLESGELIEPLEKFRQVLEEDPNFPRRKEIEGAIQDAGILYFGADGAIFRVNGVGGMAQKVVDGGIDPQVAPAQSPAGGEKPPPAQLRGVAYVKPAAHRDVRGSIYLLDQETGKSTKVHDSTKSTRPLWTLDGNLLFSKERTLWLVSPRGDVLEKGQSIAFVDGRGRPYFDTMMDRSPDGQWLVCIETDPAKRDVSYVFKLKSDFSTGEIVASIPAEKIRSADWSQAGNRIVFTTDKGLYIASATGGGRDRFLSTEEHGYDFASATWSPTGSTLLFVARQGEEGAYGLYQVNLDKKIDPVPIEGVESIDPVHADWVRGHLEEPSGEEAGTAGD